MRFPENISDELRAKFKDPAITALLGTQSVFCAGATTRVSFPHSVMAGVMEELSVSVASTWQAAITSASVAASGLTVPPSWNPLLAVGKIGNELVEAIRVLCEITPEVEAACERLAALGWALPMDLGPREIVDLAVSRSDKEIDEMMTEYYVEDEYSQLQAVWDRLREASNLIAWSALLEEAFDAFLRGHFQLPVPALLIILEGVMAAECGKLLTHEIRVANYVTKWSSKAKPKSIEALTRRSAEIFVASVFAHSDFTLPVVAGIKRNRILHGRDVGPWAMVASVQLFAVLDIIRK